MLCADDSGTLQCPNCLSADAEPEVTCVRFERPWLVAVVPEVYLELLPAELGELEVVDA